MSRFYRSSILSLVMILLPITFFGQRHYFIPYSVNEGLAQSQVRDMVQSDDGYIWIATVGGISRFNGNRFTTFNKSNGLMNNLTNALYQSDDASVIASCVGGLVEIKGNAITSFPFDDTFTTSLVNAFVQSDDGLILGTNGKGLLYFQDGVVRSQIDLGSKGKNFIRSMSKAENGILAGTKRGLILIDDQQNILELNDSISVTSIERFDQTHWIATNGDGLFRYQDGVLRQYTKADGLRNMYVRDVCMDATGYPWIISKNSIQHLDPQNGKFKEIRSVDPEITSNMKVLLMDAEGNLWIGTDGYGILKFTGEQFEIYNTEDGISSNIVMDIDEWKPGSFAFATYGNGVTLRSPEGTDTITDRNGLSNLTVWSLLPVGDELWMGTSDGIQIYDGKRANPFAQNDQLPFPRISNMYEDGSGNVWIATRNGPAFWNGDSLGLPAGLQGIELKDVKGFVEVGTTVWITSNGGLIGFDGKVAKRLNRESGFPEDYLTCISAGNQEDLWIGSEEGLIRFDTKTEEHVLFPISDRLSSNVINFLVNEGQRHLWIGTDNGLFRLDLALFYRENEVRFEGFNQHDGIISNECNQNAAYVDREGNAWFGMNGGLIKYQHAQEQEVVHQVLGIRFSDVQQNFESVLDRIDLTAEEADANPFRYNDNRITFRYSAIHFTNPDRLSFSYRLIGVDEGWSPPTKEEYITFSNLSPGEYEFAVRARINDESWSEPERFRFVINPPFWMRWWFILLCLSVTAFITYWIGAQMRTQRSRKKAFTEMQQQARILGLEQQTLNAHMNRHFIFNALNSIQYYINTQDRNQANQYLTNFAALVRKNLDSAQVESIYLKEELERLKLYINLEQMRFKDRFSFEIILEEDIDASSIQVPSMILQPFVENSIMHGILPGERFGNISITINRSEEGVQFTIDDNGIGIDTSVQRKNETSHHVSNGMKITKQRIDLLAQATNKRFGVFGPTELKGENGETIGTRVVIELPLNYQPYKTTNRSITVSSE